MKRSSTGGIPAHGISAAPIGLSFPKTKQWDSDERGRSMGTIEELLSHLRGELVRVESMEGKRFEGTLKDVWAAGPGVILRGARELPGDARFPTVFVRQVNWIVVPVTE